MKLNVTDDMSKLKVGQEIFLSGTIFTARDKAHLILLEKEFPHLKNSIIYHCGPVIQNKNIISAGPTTSARMNGLSRKLIDKYSVKAIIGKGGMNAEKIKGTVYLSAVGGAGVVYARRSKIKDVFFPELGMADAIWKLEITEFPLIVTIDAQGNSLHDEIEKSSRANI
jgi:fumarate hydratase subunit beta